MKREVQAILLVLLGSAVLRISLFSDMYLRYVRAALRPYLVTAGVVLVLLGVLGAVAALRGARHQDHQDHQDSDHDAHGHSHTHGPRIAWLLILPVTGILLVSPPALGSYTAQHAANTVAKPDTATGFPPLPAGDPLALPLAEFDVRAAWDAAQPLKGRRVKLLGFVSPKSGGGWYVTRLVISCCAADAMTYKVEIRGAAAPPTGSWVAVTGVWQPDGQPAQPDAVPALNAGQVVSVPEPRDPYE
ncbi:putative repeat protein (TIGR03943 family) [Kitasatospora sp. GAS204A]|uniref:TIGR03943 family putative permease subunit n=1 Tax=unclassified Kitasatospora TaxID=2633591 RepID=UPI002476469C|nr:TIGR03943 family protein [Kitasatospora sp. GAS204B]MDH6117018.1 putative repeat protein (TIGR03943 family) [Kitasatospora sp. GAS204B]